MPCACSEDIYEPTVQVEENGKIAIFFNPQKLKFTKTQVDGCLIKQSLACDWYIVRADADGVLVELKGRDITHALKQLEASFAYLHSVGRLTNRMASLVVGGKPYNYPGFTTKVQRTQEKLWKDYGATFHLVRDKYEDHLDPLFARPAYKRPQA